MNTGTQIVTTLEKKNLTTGVLTGITKPNVPGDPDYIAPSENLVACPLPVAMACPTVKAVKSGGTSVRYEFSAPAHMLLLATLVKIRVTIWTAADVLAGTHDYTDFDPNFFDVEFTGLTAGVTYHINIEFLGAADLVLHSCTNLATVELDSVISWIASGPACVTEPTCAEGWVLDETGTQCEQVTETPATPPSGGGGTPGTAVAAAATDWSRGGATVFALGWPISGDGTPQYNLITPHLWVNGTSQFHPSANLVDGRMNAAGVWVSPDVSSEWIGFARQITLPVGKTMYIGMAADNKFRFALNGVDIVNNTGNLQGGPNHNYWNVYPVAMPSGVNYIEMYGMNLGGPGGFAVEIYDATIAQLQAVTTEAELEAYIIFSSKDVRGEPFDLGVTVGYSCPAGYVLDNSDPDPANWVCKQIVQTPATMVNTGMKTYATRTRLASGIPDGTVEDNDEDGEGPYFPPEEDLITCPIPE